MNQGRRPQYGGAQGLTHPNEYDILSNLMVNYIPSQVDEAYLRQMFEAYGVVDSVKIIQDKETNSSRGFGFVKYRQPQSASLAINNLNGYAILNKRLKVAYAKPDEAQRLLQHMQQMDSAAPSSSTIAPSQQQPLDANQLYYLQQIQAQQLWLQQMQQAVVNNQQSSPGVGQPAISSSMLSPQQQQLQQQHMMMLLQQQQQSQPQQNPALS
eukprot:CAMPEP_0201478516 /NCGR_PEP_ID=MMETSP0151_2-20130828/3332_1 /ASSEMBLY_ACC=CAM_ASM_000257 /TAXON_ID=200890 /ORGANISM="Paramoeba atlantica, Strain 621/1 / CCAP 1560/9" /LENGTH=210 /DNA_ID=CAMNT_0047859611 /DNA_START=79 /DNA_END=711 /DNA_ORIENTATION=-